VSECTFLQMVMVVHEFQGLSKSSDPSQHIWTTLASFKPSKIKTAQIEVSQQHI